MKKKTFWKIGKWAILIVLCLAIYSGVRAKLNSLFSWHLPSITFGDPVMGYNTSEIQSTIAGESRKENELIVFEQDVKVTSSVSNTLLNIDWFKKTQTIHSFGTGIYVVELSGITADNITVDTEKKTITVTVPHAVLKTVTVDYAKTEFDDVQRNIFGWGDISLTSEQQNLVEQEIQTAMNAECEKETYLKQADSSAKENLSALYRNALTKLNPEAEIIIQFAD